MIAKVMQKYSCPWPSPFRSEMDFVVKTLQKYANSNWTPSLNSWKINPILFESVSHKNQNIHAKTHCGNSLSQFFVKATCYERNHKSWFHKIFFSVSENLSFFHTVKSMNFTSTYVLRTWNTWNIFREINLQLHFSCTSISQKFCEQQHNSCQLCDCNIDFTKYFFVL